MENGHQIERIAVLEAELARCHEDRRAVTQREVLFRLFCDGAQDYAFVMLDLENRIIGWSRGAECILGYSNAEILGQCGGILFSPEDDSTDEVKRELLLAQLQNRAEFERWHRRKDGSRFWGSGVMVPLHDAAGQQHGFGKIFRDLTARKEREDRLTASLNERDLLLRDPSLRQE